MGDHKSSPSLETRVFKFTRRRARTTLRNHVLFNAFFFRCVRLIPGVERNARDLN